MELKKHISKKLMSVLLTFCLLFSVMPMTVFAADAPTDQWSNYAADSFAGGTGTSADPYQIATAAQLAKLAKDVAGGEEYVGTYFQLTDNIDLRGYRWNPIGVYFWGLDDTTISESFAGILDGNEKTVTGLYVDERSTCYSAGLFGDIRGTSGDTSVCDLTIEDAVIYASDANSMNTYAGIFTGAASANDIDSVSFENIKVSGTVVCEGSGYVVAGGMVGYTSRGHFTSCVADSVNISGSGNMGGFVGMDGEALFKNCVAKGRLTGLWALGGFSGYSWDSTGTGGDDIVQSTFDHCYADVDVTASDWRAGGFVGFAEDGIFNNCVAMGDVTSTVSEWEPKVGGFVGDIYAATMDKCHAGGVVIADHPTYKAGGFIGNDAAGTVGAVTGSSFDNELNPDLTAVGVSEMAGQHTITGASSKNVIANICKDYYGNAAHKYDNSKDMTCNSCGFTRLPGEIRIHEIDLVNGDDDHTLALGNGTAVYDPKTQTLTLTDAQITLPSGNVDAGIYISGFNSDVTIKLVGENTIHLTDTAYDNLGIWNYSKYGLNIEGTGSLDVKLFGGTYGIMNRDGDVNIEDATLNFELLDGSATNGFLIDSSYNVSLKNATLTADGFMMGIFGEKSVAIEESDVTLNMLESGVYSDGDITIEDSRLTFTGAYEGICAWGQTVVVDSELDLESEWSNAIYSYGSLEISGGDVTLVAQDNTAVYVNGGIIIDGDAMVEIDGQNGYGIYTDEIVDVKSGTVSIKGSARAICATRVSENDLNTKPTDSPVALVIGEGYAEENDYKIQTDDWAVRTVWDSWLFEEIDKWQSLSYFVDKDGNKVTEVSIVAVENVTITENTENTTVTYDGNEIDLASLFNIDSNAGAATYTVTNGTGEGTVEDGKLTVTKAGTFTVKIYTAPAGKYAAGTLTATLTVNPKVIGIQWGETSFIYTEGTVQLPIVIATGIEGNDVVALEVVADKESIDAGTYTATVTGINDGADLYVLPDDGLSVTFTIADADQAAPTGLTATNETISGKADGKISGLTTDMEYSTSADGEYTKITDPAMTFASGTYFIRYSAKDNHNASSPVEITVEAGKKLTVTFMVDGKVYETLSVDYNATLTLPEAPAKDGYTVKWDKEVTTITEDMTITAVYTENSVVVPGDPEIPDSPQTGDNSNMALWISLLFISSAIVALTVYDKKKQAVGK